MFTPRPDTARPAASHSLDHDDEVDMFIPRSGVARHNHNAACGERGNPTPSGSRIALIRNPDIEIDDSDMFIPRPSGDRQPSSQDHRTLHNDAKRHRSSTDFDDGAIDDQHVEADGMEFTPREDISRPARPVEGDASEAALRLIRWAMQARALLATIEALQSKFKFD